MTSSTAPRTSARRCRRCRARAARLLRARCRRRSRSRWPSSGRARLPLCEACSVYSIGRSSRNRLTNRMMSQCLRSAAREATVSGDWRLRQTERFDVIRSWHTWGPDPRWGTAIASIHSWDAEAWARCGEPIT